MLRLHLFSCFYCGKSQHAVALVQLYFFLTAEQRINLAAMSSFKIQYKVSNVQYDIVHRILLHVFVKRTTVR